MSSLSISDKWEEFACNPVLDKAESHGYFARSGAHLYATVATIPGMIGEIAFVTLAQLANLLTLNLVPFFRKAVDKTSLIQAPAPLVRHLLQTVNPDPDCLDSGAEPHPVLNFCLSLLDPIDPDTLGKSSSLFHRQISSRLSALLWAVVALVAGAIEGALGMVAFVFALLTLGRFSILNHCAIELTSSPILMIQFALSLLTGFLAGPRTR